MESFGRRVFVLSVILVNIGTLYWINHKFDSRRVQDKEETKFATNGQKPPIFLTRECTNDQKKLNDLLSKEPMSMDIDSIQELLQTVMKTPCGEIKPFGGKYLRWCKIFDGHKYVCVDNILEHIRMKKCLIYSFGVSNEYAFETTMASLGCEVHAFDHTVNISGVNFNFSKIGISNVKTNQSNLETLGALIRKNGHTERDITMVKMDVEGAELTGIDTWLDEGAFKNVHQFALEYHAHSEEQQQKFLATVQRLNRHKFRAIHWEANACYQNVFQKNSAYFNLAEIVWMKIPDPYNVSEVCGF